VGELFPPQGQWTEEDYFALPDTNRYVELSDGELIMPPHPTNRHQVTVLELTVRLRQFVLENRLGYMRVAPLPVRLWPGKIREPDVFFIAKEHTDRIGEQVCGVPDLIIGGDVTFHDQAGPDGEVRGIRPGRGPGVLGCGPRCPDRRGVRPATGGVCATGEVGSWGDGRLGPA